MWSEPKTNWRSIDYYNIEDWQRVRSNLEHIHSWLEEHKVSGLSLLETSDSEDCNAMPFVHFVNNMEQNLENLQKLFGTDFTGDVERKVWYARLDEMYSSNPTYLDWNRWEYVLLCIYESIQYIDTYIFTPISGASRCGSERTLIRFSKGR